MKATQSTHYESRSSSKPATGTIRPVSAQSKARLVRRNLPSPRFGTPNHTGTSVLFAPDQSVRTSVNFYSIHISTRSENPGVVDVSELFHQHKDKVLSVLSDSGVSDNCDSSESGQLSAASVWISSNVQFSCRYRGRGIQEEKKTRSLRQHSQTSRDGSYYRPNVHEVHYAR